MVNLDIPKVLSPTPNSQYGTPHLTINRDATIDLDSTSAFEGPEKLLEVWFSPSEVDLPAGCAPNGLKSVNPEVWKEMLDLVHCKVLSVVGSEHVDAYLLSESSMFVFPHKVILKTCGTTTLLYGLPRLLEIAALDAGFPHVEADLKAAVAAAAAPYRVFYSRKNFLYPTKQQGPHRSWIDEIRYLDRLFLHGSAYLIGKMNGEHWYLYITGPNTQLTPPTSPIMDTVTETKFLNASSMENLSISGDQEDETLEILMTDLDEQNAKQFYLEHASAVAEGRYFQKARTARHNAIHSLGTLQSLSNHKDTGSAFHDSDDSSTFDVFGQFTPSSEESPVSATSSSLDSSTIVDLHTPTLPEELATEGHTLGTVVTETCGLSDVYPASRYPDARIDAYLFTPCGFSANGVIPAPSSSVVDSPVSPTTTSTTTTPTTDCAMSSKQGSSRATHYFTVHVTPEPHCSYASFETNVPARQSGRQTADIVEHVVRIFRPGRFSVTLFETRKEDSAGGVAGTGAGGVGAVGGGRKAGAKSRMDAIDGYRRVDRIVHDLDGYELVFRYYERLDWKGGAPRLGEVGLGA